MFRRKRSVKRSPSSRVKLNEHPYDTLIKYGYLPKNYTQSIMREIRRYSNCVEDINDLFKTTDFYRLLTKFLGEYLKHALEVGDITFGLARRNLNSYKNLPPLYTELVNGNLSHVYFKLLGKCIKDSDSKSKKLHKYMRARLTQIFRKVCPDQTYLLGNIIYDRYFEPNYEYLNDKFIVLNKYPKLKKRYEKEKRLLHKAESREYRHQLRKEERQYQRQKRRDKRAAREAKNHGVLYGVPEVNVSSAYFEDQYGGRQHLGKLFGENEKQYRKRH